MCHVHSVTNARVGPGVPKGARVTDSEDQSTLDVAAIVRSIGDVAYEWRLDSDVLIWSANAREVFGDLGAIGSGRAYAHHIDAEGGQSRLEVIEQSADSDLGAGVPYQVEYAFCSPGERGARIWLEDSGRWFAGPDGKPARAHGIVRAINERHEHEFQLLRLAKFDPLTGEMNRAHLTEVLQSILDEAVRFRASCGFMLVAIDHLGKFNDAYGFDVTDEIISKMAKRIHERLRSKDHFGRVSGNKFGVILTRCTPDELEIAAERLLAGVRDETITTEAGPVAVTVSIGGVTAPRHARSVPEILSRAEDALHSARTKRIGSFHAYHPSLEREAMRRDSMRATDEICAALNERRVTLAYEPVVKAKNRQVAFYECLMRVNRADGRVAQANEIVPIAERLGLVRMLDHRMLELAVEELTGEPELTLSINVSPASTVDPDWWTGLSALLRNGRAAAERLIIEITETAAIQNVDDARGFVTRVKDLGCRIAIDDFGAGNTSYRHLRKLGVDIVKIDGAFVQDVVKSEDDRAFVRTLIDLTRRLKLKVVAEWVQDEAAATLLSDWGCDYLQGALIGLAASERPRRVGTGRLASG